MHKKIDHCVFLNINDLTIKSLSISSIFQFQDQGLRNKSVFDYFSFKMNRKIGG